MPELTPAQTGKIEELEARLTAWTEDGEPVIQKADGVQVILTEAGEVKELELTEPEIVADEDVTVADDIDDYKPSAEMLLVDPDDRQDVFRAMDRADEVQILDELAGRAIKAMVYSFEQKGGGLMTDLSVGGVNETIRLMNERGGTRIGISPQPPVKEVVERGEENYWQVMAYAIDGRTGVGRWGVALEPEYVGSGAKRKWDKFGLTKALNKAQRNALRAHIPEEFRQTVIALFLEQDARQELKPLGAGTATFAELPPPVEGPEAEKARKEVEAVWEELKEASPNRLPKGMPPAKFNSIFTQVGAESTERIENFRDHLQELLDALVADLTEEAAK